MPNSNKRVHVESENECCVINGEQVIKATTEVLHCNDNSSIVAETINNNSEYLKNTKKTRLDEGYQINNGGNSTQSNYHNGECTIIPKYLHHPASQNSPSPEPASSSNSPLPMENKAALKIQHKHLVVKTKRLKQTHTALSSKLSHTHQSQREILLNINQIQSTYRYHHQILPSPPTTTNPSTANMTVFNDASTKTTAMLIHQILQKVKHLTQPSTLHNGLLPESLSLTNNRTFSEEKIKQQLHQQQQNLKQSNIETKLSTDSNHNLSKYTKQLYEKIEYYKENIDGNNQLLNDSTLDLTKKQKRERRLKHSIKFITRRKPSSEDESTDTAINSTFQSYHNLPNPCTISQPGNEIKPTSSNLMENIDPLSDLGKLAQERLENIYLKNDELKKCRLSHAIPNKTSQYSAKLIDKQVYNDSRLRSKSPDRSTIFSGGTTSIQPNPDETTLLDKFSLLYNQAEFTNKINEELCSQFQLRYKNHLQQYEDIASDQHNLEHELLRDLRDVEGQYKRLKRENDRLLVDFEKISSDAESGAPLNEEMREILITMQLDVASLKQILVDTKRKLFQIYDKIKSEIFTHSKKCNESSNNKTPSSRNNSSEGKSETECKKEELSDAKTLLDCYKTFLKDSRSKAQILQRIEDIKVKVESSELVASGTKIPQKADQLLKNLDATYHQNEQYSAEVSATSAAYETMQIENLRLLQQVREKETANFNLINKNIKMQAIARLTEEERKILQQYIKYLTHIKDQQATAIQTNEERDKLYAAQADHIQNQSTFVGMHSGKIKKSQWESSDLVQKAVQQLQKIEETNRSKYSEIETLISNICDIELKNTRLEEKILSINRLLERQKQENSQSSSSCLAKSSTTITMDDILQEEAREYRAKLKCKLCNKHDKNAVLTKCWHVFCFTCLQKRYDAKQRKCPKCGVSFTKSELQKIYLEFS